MKKLIADFIALNNSVAKFVEVLEDKYESPVMADKLEYFHDCLAAIAEYDLQRPENEELLEEEKLTQIRMVQFSQEMLGELETVNAESNVFDILEVLKKLASFSQTILIVAEDRGVIQ